MSLQDLEIHEYSDIFFNQRQELRKHFPEMYAPLTLVVNTAKPNAKKQLRKEQYINLKNWGIK